MWKFNFTCFRLKICSQQTDSWLVIYENVDISCTCLLKYIVSVKYLESDFQQYFSYIMAASFVGGGNRRNPEKTTDLPQVTDKL